MHAHIHRHPAARASPIINMTWSALIWQAGVDRLRGSRVVEEHTRCGSERCPAVGRSCMCCTRHDQTACAPRHARAAQYTGPRARVPSPPRLQRPAAAWDASVLGLFGCPGAAAAVAAAAAAAAAVRRTMAGRMARTSQLDPRHRYADQVVRRGDAAPHIGRSATCGAAGLDPGACKKPLR
jgi:hypothetical protein